MTDGTKQKILIILNDPPYGTERSYNGLRLANSLTQRDDNELRVFLLGDAVACAKRGQQTPNGYYNLERMIGVLPRRGQSVSTCGTCLDARGISVEELVEGVHRGTLDELTEWTVWADKVLVF